MLTLGLRMVKRGTTRSFTGVILDETGNSAPVTIQHVCDGGTNHAQQARELRDWLNTSLAATPGIERAILFEADHAPRPSDTDATRLRLRLEGAALTAALDRVPLVEVRNGRGLGALIGGSKQAALDLGAAVGVPELFAEAAAAALAAARL